MKTKNTIKIACLATLITFLAILTIDAQIHLQGLRINHEGLVAWNADGTGNESKAQGHHFDYGKYTWQMAYYVASRDYLDIDPNNKAALCRFTDEVTGFPNLKFQLHSLGYSMDQLKIKSGISSLGNNVRGRDWGIDDSIHWYRLYGNTLTIELVGQPILNCVIDTNYCFANLNDETANWYSYTSTTFINDISINSTADAQIIANAFLSDLNGRPVKLSIEGRITKGETVANGRDGTFHEINSGTLCPVELEQAHATTKKTSFKTKQLASKTEKTFNINKYEMRSLIKISANPNPFRNNLNVLVDLNKAENIKLEVYNFVGTKITSLANGKYQSGKYEFNWNAGELREGIYFIRVHAGDATITRKVVKTK